MIILLIVMFVAYLVLVIWAARKELFILPTPVEVTHIDVAAKMKDAKREERTIGRDLFEKFKSTLGKTATNPATMPIVIAMVIATFMLFGAWANFGMKGALLCILGIFVGYICYSVIKGKQKKLFFVQNRDKFRMQLGYVLDTQTKSIDYIYKKAGGSYHKGTSEFHKVLIGIISEDGTPETYLVPIDHFTFLDIMKSELCDVVTYDGHFVAACYLIQKEPKEISLFKGATK